MNIFQKILFPFSWPKTQFLENKWWHRLVKILLIIFVFFAFFTLIEFPNKNDYFTRKDVCKLLQQEVINSSNTWLDHIETGMLISETKNYIPDINWPGLTKKQIDRLEDQAKNINDPLEKRQEMQRLYKNILPIAKQEKQKHRVRMLNKICPSIMNAVGDWNTDILRFEIRSRELANAIKRKEQLPITAPDDEVLNIFFERNNVPTEVWAWYFGSWDDYIFSIGDLVNPEDYELKANSIIQYIIDIFWVLLSTILILYIILIAVQFLYFKWIIYVVYGNKK